MKLTRKRSAATPHAAFEVAGNGNQDMVRPLKALSLRKRGENRLAIPKSMAPFLDPTDRCILPDEIAKPVPSPARNLAARNDGRG